MLVVRDTMLAEGRNSRASSGLPKKIGTGEERKRGRRGPKGEKRKLAGEGDNLSWILREEAEERTEDF